MIIFFISFNFDLSSYFLDISRSLACDLIERFSLSGKMCQKEEKKEDTKSGQEI
jgi:hypothetical protein